MPLPVEAILKRNRQYASTIHKPPPRIHDAEGNKRPSTGMLIISCVDSRIIPEKFLGLAGSETERPLPIPVVRVIGGRAKKAINDIVALDPFFGLATVVVIHHTDCGLTHATDEKIRAVLRQRHPDDAAEIETLTFGEIKDMDQSVVEDIRVLREAKYIRDEIVIRGFVYDIETGLLREVEAPEMRVDSNLSSGERVRKEVL